MKGFLKSAALAACVALLELAASTALAAGCTTTMPDQAKSDFLAGMFVFAPAYATGVANKVGDRIIASSNVYELTAAMTGTGLTVTSPTGTTTSTDNGGTWTYIQAAHVYKIVLIKSGMAGTYGSSSKFYSDITGNSDEVANSGSYSAGGITLSSLTITVASNHAQVDWADAVATSATISSACAAIIDTSHGNRIVSIQDFGGTKTSTSGTFTVQISAGVEAIN